jgi:hypothetical protein
MGSHNAGYQHAEINPPPVIVQYHYTILLHSLKRFAGKKTKPFNAVLWIRNFFVLVGSGIIILFRKLGGGGGQLHYQPSE